VYHSSPPYQYVAFVDRSNNLSGNVDLLDFFNYVISKGWMPRSSMLYQIGNGVELVSTNNRSEKFAINNFSINMKAYEVRPRLSPGSMRTSKHRYPSGPKDNLKQMKKYSTANTGPINGKLILLTYLLTAFTSFRLGSE